VDQFYISEQDEDTAVSRTAIRGAADKTCALCWRTLADEPDALVRVCEDGSVLSCHRSHAMMARIHGFRELADVPYQSPFTRLAIRRSLPAKELGI